MLAFQASAQYVQGWGNNGTAAPTSGTWDTTTANWAPSNTLSASMVTFTNGNFALFTASNTAVTSVSALTITVPGAVTCEGIGDGVSYNSAGLAAGAAVASLNFVGAGSINLPAGSWSFTCGASANNMIFNVPITGAGQIVQHNGGAFSLYANNTYSGGTSATGGQVIYYNNNNSFGTGAISTSGGGTSFWCTNGPGDIVTVTNAWTISSGTTAINFVNGDTICTGPWALGAAIQLKNSSPPTTNLTVSGVISGAFGITYGTPAGGTITLGGANTYTGSSTIALSGATATLSVSSINSVSTPAQQANSSLGKPSSAATGIIGIGTAGFGGTLIYTGAGETSDRQINMGGTTGGATIEMDGAGPLVLTGNVGVGSGDNGAKTLTLQGTSTAANTISGTISNSTSATSLTKAQAGSWTLAGTNRFSGSLTISAGTLTIGGTGNLNAGSYGGAISDAGTLVFASSIGQTWSGVLSGAGKFNVAAPAGAALTLSGSSSTFTGLFTITSGTLSVNADAGFGTVPGTAVTNAITFNGGPAASLRANANGIVINANRGINLGANGGSIQVAGNDTCTYNGIISGSGPFQNGQNASTGLGILVLGGSEAYTNTTVLAAGTLRLASTASLGNSAGILMSNSPTLDVSAFTPFVLSTTNTFTVIGASNTPTTPAIILGPVGGAVDFGTQTVNLSYAPSWTNGDASHVVLNILQSELALNGNTVNVTNASGTTLDVGNYALIQAFNGFAIAAPLNLNYVGNLMPNTTASLAIINNTNLVLQVMPAAGYANSTFTNQSPYPTQPAIYGTPTINVAGTVVAGSSYPAQGETVSVIIPKVSTNTTTISDSTGDFSLALPINTVPVGTYPITYSYAGNGTIGLALDTSSALTITKTGLTVTATPQTKTYGQTLGSGVGQTAFTPTGLQNGETIGTVTLAFSGSPAGSAANAGTNTYTITPSAATGGTFSAGNYSITYVTNTLTVTPLPLGLTGARLYDGTATALFSILSITNIVSGDAVSLTSGSATLASSAAGVEPITDATGLIFSSTRGTNYTTIGATGAVTITNIVNTASTNIMTSFANGQLTLTWPQDHTGWQLQVQTNDLTLGLGTNWVDVAGSTTTNQVIIPINVTNGSVFYRMVYPPQ